MTQPRQHYTLVCSKCEKVIMLTRRSLTHQRPVRYGLCNMCAPQATWNARNAPRTQFPVSR